MEAKPKIFTIWNFTEKKVCPQVSADKVASDHLNLIRDLLDLSSVAILERPTLICVLPGP